MKLDFDKMGGLVPAIIQDIHTQKVLMLGFMNEEAYQKTVESGKVTFTAVPSSACGPREKKAEISCTSNPSRPTATMIPC